MHSTMPFSSSPDPLSLPSAPSIARRPRRSVSRSPSKPRRTPQPRSTCAVQIHSPAKMTATSNSHLSPWRIKVMVEAEHDGGSDDELGRIAPPNFTLGFAGEEMDMEVLPNPRQRKSRDRPVGVKTRTRTTKVPVKGLSSSPEVHVEAMARSRTIKVPVKGLDSSPVETVKPKGRRATPAPRRLTLAAKSAARKTPKPAATPTRKRATPAKAKAKAAEVDQDNDEEEREEVNAASPPQLGTTPVRTPAQRSPRTSRTPRTPTVLTLASTRTRRSSIAPISYMEGPASAPKRSARSASVVSDGERRALSGRDPNSMVSPPAKSDTPLPSAQGSRISRRGESVASSQSIGESFIISEGGSMALPEDRSGFPDSIDDSTALSQFGALEDEDEDMSEEEALADLPTASMWQSGNTPEADLDMTYISIAALHTSRAQQEATGQHDGEEEGEEEREDVDMDEVSSLLSEELLQPVEADFTYISDGRSFTPKVGHRSSNRAESPLFEDDPVTQESFYGLPDSSPPRYKGKGKVVEEEEDETATRKESFPPSPPFRVVIPYTRRSESQSIATPAPGNKRGPEADAPDAPASKRCTDRETPNLTLVREASEIMSDALEVEESMQMIEEEFGNDFDGPPTPESQENVIDEMEDDPRPDPTRPQICLQPEQEEKISYPTLDDTAISSPTSRLPQESPPAPTGYLARIFSPFRRTPSRPATPSPAHAPAEAPTHSGPSHTRSRSVHFEDETSLDARQRAAARTEMVEIEETAKYTEEVGSTTLRPVSDATKALLAEWDRQRSDVCRQAKEVGAITINDSTESNEHSNRENSSSPIALKFKKPATTASSNRTSTTTKQDTTPETFKKPVTIASSSRPSPPTTTANADTAREETLTDSLLDDITAIPPTPISGLVWSKADYRHLDLILSSSSTSPSQATKCYKVQLDRPERILAREVVASLALDEEGYLTLSRKESAAVDRFLRREKTKGREWTLVEIVRRTAGMRVAQVRREWVGKK